LGIDLWIGRKIIEKEKIMDDATVRLVTSLEDSDDESDFTCDDEGLAPLH
jgi:hypothetical protein